MRKADLILLLATAPALAAAAPYAIVVGAGAPPLAKLAAAELQRYIERIFAFTAPIGAAAPVDADNLILVRNSGAAPHHGRISRFDRQNAELGMTYALSKKCKEQRLVPKSLAAARELTRQAGEAEIQAWQLGETFAAVACDQADLGMLAITNFTCMRTRNG